MPLKCGIYGSKMVVEFPLTSTTVSLIAGA
jgi:hypothetical protein